MAVTYGIDYPFRDSPKGDYLNMTEIPEKEIRANLIHLILTRKGSRYYLPDFGTRIYQYIFDQNDAITYNLIEEEIREGVKKFIPNLDITNISITSAEDDPIDKEVSHKMKMKDYLGFLMNRQNHIRR